MLEKQIKRTLVILVMKISELNMMNILNNTYYSIPQKYIENNDGELF